MELNIISPTQDMELTPITWNYEDLKTEISQKTQVYKMMVFGEDQMDEAKRNRASLNSLDKALNDKKIALKKMYLEPYETFEIQIKELQKMIKDASASIDKQVKDFEDKERKEKLDKALSTLLDFASVHGLQQFVPSAGWETLVNPKWGNKSVSYKAIAEDAEAIVIGIKQDLATINGMTDNPFKFEMIDYYKRCVNLGQTLAEGERLKRLDAEKKAHQERQQSLREASEAPIQAVPASRPPSPPPAAEVSSEPLHTLTFEVTGTYHQLMALSTFLKTEGIPFKQVKE